MKEIYALVFNNKIIHKSCGEIKRIQYFSPIYKKCTFDFFNRDNIFQFNRHIDINVCLRNGNVEYDEISLCYDYCCSGYLDGVVKILKKFNDDYSGYLIIHRLLYLSIVNNRCQIFKYFLSFFESLPLFEICVDGKIDMIIQKVSLKMIRYIIKYFNIDTLMLSQMIQRGMIHKRKDIVKYLTKQFNQQIENFLIKN